MLQEYHFVTKSERSNFKHKAKQDNNTEVE